MSNDNGSRSILKGVSVLGITGIVCKVVGVLYSIPLAHVLGMEGLGLFQMVFPTYNFLLTVSSAGLPVAVSRIVSHYLTRKDPRNAKRTFTVAMQLLLSLGVFFSLLMVFLNGFLCNMVGSPDTSAGFYAIAPCVAVVCALSAFRGFIQGQQNMVPTAVSQLIEQVGKVVISLPLAGLGMQKGIEYGAAGALLGITVIEFAALAYMVIRHLITRKSFESKYASDAPSSPPLPSGDLMRKLITISIPITISACIIPLAQFVDSTLMVKRLVHAGIDLKTAKELYGGFSGMVIRLINIPTALALAISMSLVPAVSAARTLGDPNLIRSRSSNGIKLSFLVGFPCSVGMSVLAKEILHFCYAEKLSPAMLQTTSELLTVSALTIVLFTVVQSTSSILQGLHYQMVPMYAMVAGVACKIALNYTLIGMPGINIHGGPIASIVCYSVALIPNLVCCCKYGKLSFDWKNWILRPGLAAAAMGLAVWGLKSVLPFGRISTLLEIAVGAAVFIGVALLDHAMDPDELRSLLKRKGKRK